MASFPAQAHRPATRRAQARQRGAACCCARRVRRPGANARRLKAAARGAPLELPGRGGRPDEGAPSTSSVRPDTPVTAALSSSAPPPPRPLGATPVVSPSETPLGVTPLRVAARLAGASSSSRSCAAPAERCGWAGSRRRRALAATAAGAERANRDLSYRCRTRLRVGPSSAWFLGAPCGPGAPSRRQRQRSVHKLTRSGSGGARERQHQLQLAARGLLAAQARALLLLARLGLALQPPPLLLGRARALPRARAA